VADDPLGGTGDIHRADDVGRTGSRFTPRHVALLVAAAVVVVLAVLNFDRVSVDLVVGSIEMPLVAMLALACGAGFLGGWWFFRRRERRRRPA